MPAYENGKGLEFKMTAKKLPKAVKVVLRGLPLAGAAAAAWLPLQRIGQQLLILIVLLWIQAYVIIEGFLAGK